TLERINKLFIQNQTSGTAILQLTLYMDFRGKFRGFFPHLVLNGELLGHMAGALPRRRRT
ncbi:MAG: hypothetical protein LBL56_03230, partial [Treponema sp.]|nr:hypothetical protein [Treponema sp.]